MKKSYFVLAALLLNSAVTYGEMYKWVDSQGHVQYSDQPPPGVNAQKINAKSAVGTHGGSGSKTYQEQDQEFRKRRVVEEEAAKKQGEAERQAKIKQKNCTDAKSYLSSLQAGGRIAKTNDKGEREYLDEKGRDAATAEAKNSVAEWCK